MSRTCAQFEEAGVVARYVANRSSAAESMEFEDHYVGCTACYEAVVTGAAIRASLKQIPRVEDPKSVRVPRRLAAAGLGLAAMFATVIAYEGINTSRVRALGELQSVPDYGGVPVRATATPAEAQFESAMSAYARGNYRNASDGLEAAIRAGNDAAVSEFFLGASMLQLDEAAAAASSFRRVIAAGESPYLVEAHYYLGKALLRLGRGGEALGLLRLAASKPDPIAPRASALADSVQKVIDRSLLRF